jgi:hypothetical protein
MKTTQQDPTEALLKEPANFSSPLHKVHSYLPTNVIDLTYINKISGGDEAFIQSTLHELSAEIQVKVAGMDKAFLEKNYNVIQRLAHEMQTTFFVLGMFKLVGAPLKNIEKMCLSRSAITDIKVIYDPVRLICKQAINETQQLMD